MTAFQMIASGGLEQMVSYPAAVRNGDYAYFGWVDGTSGDVKVCSFNLVTLTPGTPIVMHAALGGSSGSPDLHDSPSVMVEASTGKLLVGYSAHHGANPLLRRSANTVASDPNLLGGFLAEQTVGAAGDYTYISLIQLTNVPNTVYLFCRNFAISTGRLGWFYSTDAGATWNAPLHNLICTISGKNLYHHIGTDGVGKVHVVITNTDRSDGDPSSLYHFYLEWLDFSTLSAYQSDGTLIAAYGAGWPFAPSAGTLVKNAADGPCHIEDVIVQPGGDPACVLMTYASSDTTQWVGRWTGTWQVDSVAAAGGLVGSNRFLANGSFQLDDVDTIQMAKKVGSFFEVYRYTSADSGSTWTGAAVTSGSVADNFEVQRVVGADARLAMTFANGSYTSDSSFAVSIWGSPG